jgi:hypothetical protein
MKYLGALAFVFFASGCASPSTQGECDPTKQLCDMGGVGGGGGDDLSVAPDLSEVADLHAPPDLTPLKKFGDPCTTPQECESGFCVFSGLSGVCSELCGPPPCPTGYGCYSVLGGGIDPGQVVQICVPENNQLCTQCNLSSECSSAGKDLCLPGPFGGNYCARDCTSVSCPTGFTCNTLNIQGLTVKQCQPTMGSCDCHNAGQMGMSLSCNILTPFGNCAGSHVCMGTSGWGNCQPPSPTDTPDATYSDDNCDGIDGDINAGIFVATTGTDASGCGATYSMPCRTVNYGLVRSVEDSKKYVYVQAGIYNEVVTLQAGKVVVGGYDTGWQRAARTVNGHETRIKGSYDSATGQYLTITGSSINVAATLMDLVVQGPDAGQTGKSSYAIYLNGAKITLTRVSVFAGNGAGGGNGSNAGGFSNPSATSGMFGTVGGDASQGFAVCDTGSRGGPGNAGTNSCAGGSVATNGGGGGYGGTKDSSCCAGQCAVICGDCSATSGSGGNSASATYSGYYGLPGAGSGTCANSNDGHPGLVFNGSGGGAGGGRGLLISSFWNAATGGSGGVGDHGSGGGGGGGSGGCDSGTDSYGAGGGGGGAGGCRSPDAGGGGSGGGGSFGVFAVSSSTVNATDCIVQRGNGANGGGGGGGGRGQGGGPGASGGNSAGGSKVGGRGGDGAHGGHGGAGAGGSGGISAAFFNYSSTITQSCALSGGAAGSGGSGGSAPAASDGNGGQTGAGGAVYDTFTCNAPGGC